MIGYLEGKIKYIGLKSIILGVNGVGYKVQLSVKSFPQADHSNKLKTENLKPASPSGGLKIGSVVELYIYHHIREDRSELYGFETMNELQIFELLLEVPGVGPKMGMNILGKAAIENIRGAIVKGDAGFFTAISGVGRKLASKILLELRNKFDSEDYDILESSNISTELMEAMESLGYKKNEIYPQLSKMPTDIKSNQEKIKWMLKNFKRK